MKLFHKHYPREGGEPVIILHGLFGNQANWSRHGGELADRFDVHALDLRNHGRSPWSDEHNYKAMAGDVLETMDELGLDSAHFIGHSMGGKTAMQCAFLAPERVARLLVVDIAPVAYAEEDSAPLEGMLAIDTDTLESRRQADAVLADYVESGAVRDFLLTNLRKRRDGGYEWRCNIEVLARRFADIKAGPEPAGEFRGPTLFVKGGKSDYLLEEHGERIMAMFPNARFRIVANAGHWVHSEKPEAFCNIAREFLASGDN